MVPLDNSLLKTDFLCVRLFVGKTVHMTRIIVGFNGFNHKYIIIEMYGVQGPNTIQQPRYLTSLAFSSRSPNSGVLADSYCISWACAWLYVSKTASS